MVKNHTKKKSAAREFASAYAAAMYKEQQEMEMEQAHSRPLRISIASGTTKNFLLHTRFT